MCVIIQKPKGKELSQKDLISAGKVNPDGFGFMYYDTKLDTIVAKKTLFTKPEEILNLVETHKDLEVAYHWRRKTHGSIIKSQAHPFQILSKKDGIEMYMMHNGVIKEFDKSQNGESDTQAFVNQVLRPMLKMKPMLIKNSGFRHFIEKYISHSKLLFMYGKGQIVKFNENLGDTYDGCWVSNKNFVAIQNVTHYSNYEDYSEYYGCGVSKYNQYWRNKTNNVQNIYSKSRAVTNKEAIDREKELEVTLAGALIYKGDPVMIYYKDSDLYEVEGKVVYVNANSALIDFKDIDGRQSNCFFYLDTGQSHTYKVGYTAIPMNGYDVKKDKLVTTTQEAIHLTNQQENTMIEDKKKVELNSTDPFQVSFQILEPKEIVVDGANKYGGLSGIEVDQVYYDPVDSSNEISILDVYNMNLQDRFSFFMSNHEQAFGMFQDLLESAVLDATETLEEMHNVA